MASVTLHVFFAGLIAFVPNTSNHPDFMTAYVVKTEGHPCKHESIIEIWGKPQVVGANMHSCALTDSKDPMTCTLRDTDLILDPTPLPQKQFIMSKPSKALPEDGQEGASREWIVQMKNVMDGPLRIKSWSDLKDDLVGARFSFGWEEMKTCGLDVDDYGDVYSYEFVDDSQMPVGGAQSVAELFEFSLRLDARPITLILRDRSDSKKTTTLRLKCSGSDCPLMISNNLDTSSCSEEEQQKHFHSYYGLARNESSVHYLPQKTDQSKKASDVYPACGDMPHMDKAREEEVKNRIVCPPALFYP